MDDWIPTNTGNTVAGGDGAFERFLTAAVAAIITIMFSWRLLAEQDSDGIVEGGAVGGLRVEDAKVQVRGELLKEIKRQNIRVTSSTSVRSEVVSSQGEGETGGASKGVVETGGASKGLVVGEDKIEYMDGIEPSVEERRIQDISLDEFVIDKAVSQEGLRKWPSLEMNESDDNFDVGDEMIIHDVSPIPPHDTMERSGMTNSAFKDFMEEEFSSYNEFDPFGNTDPFGDNIEPRVLDSDEEMFCCNMLETIMEEDSDEIPSSESDTDSLKRHDPSKFQTEPMQSSDSESDIDTKHRSNSLSSEFKNESNQLRRYTTQKLQNDELLEAEVPEHKTNEISDSDEDDEEESESSTSQVSLFTRETITITDSEGNLERRNVVHKVKMPMPLSDDCTIQQLMSQVPVFPVEASAEETTHNSSGSDESVVTVLTRQNSTTTIDSSGSPKMIEHANGNTSSAFPAFAPGYHGDVHRSENNSASTRQPDADRQSSIIAQSPYYNDNTSSVTTTNIVHKQPNSSTNLVGAVDESKSAIYSPFTAEAEVTVNASATPAKGSEVTQSGSDDKNVNVSKSNLPFNASTETSEASSHSDSAYNESEFSYRQKVSDIINRHKATLSRALKEQQPLILGKLPKINIDKLKLNDSNSVSGSQLASPSHDEHVEYASTSRLGNVNIVQETNVTSKQPESTGSNEQLINSSNVERTSEVNLDSLQSRDSKASQAINDTRSLTDNAPLSDFNQNVPEDSDRVKYTDAYVSTAVKDSPQSFTFATCHSEVVDYEQKYYTLERDSNDIQDLQCSLERPERPVPAPRKRSTVEVPEAQISENEPSAKVQKNEEFEAERNPRLKVIIPLETDIDDNSYYSGPQVSSHRQLTRTDTVESEEIGDRSFDDDDEENLACVEEVIGSYHSDASPRLALNSDASGEAKFASPTDAKKAKLETNIDDVFEDNAKVDDDDEEEWGEELIEVYDDETGRWILQTPNGEPKEFLNDVPGKEESERDIFLKRCVRKSTEDSEPISFLDFSRGVEENPSDGLSPVRTSSPVTVIDDRPKTTFKVISPTTIEPVLQAASEKLSTQASVEESPVVKVGSPRILQDKQNIFNSITPQENSVRKPTPKRQKSRETTFGAEPNPASKETTFGPEPVQASHKETTFGAEPEQPKSSPKPKSKQTTFADLPPKAPQAKGTRTIHETVYVNKENTKRTVTEVRETTRETRSKYTKRYESNKPTKLDLQEQKSSTTLERDNPFRINTPERQKLIQFNTNNQEEQTYHLPVHKGTDDTVQNKQNLNDKEGALQKQSRETLIDDPAPYSKQSKETVIDDPKETLIDDTVSHYKETLIDDIKDTDHKDINRPSIERENPFTNYSSEGKEQSITSTVRIESKTVRTVQNRIVRATSKETLIDDPALTLPANSKETLIDDPQVTVKSPSQRQPNNSYSQRRSSSKETLIDDPSPVVKIPRRPSQETSIDDLHSGFQSPKTEKKTPIRKTTSRETLIDDPSPTIKLPSQKSRHPQETTIDDPAVRQVAVSPTIKSPTVKLPNHLSRSRETLIDDPAPIVTRPVIKAPVKKSIETVIDEPTKPLVQSPIVKPPGSKFKGSIETDIDAPLPQEKEVQKRRAQETLIDEPSVQQYKETLIDDPVIKTETLIDKPSLEKHKETRIDAPVVKNQVYRESIIDGPTISIEKNPSVKPPTAKKPQEKDSLAKPVVAKTSVETSIDEPSASIAKSPTVRPPIARKPKEISVDEQNRKIKPPITSKPTETAIDEPFVPIAESPTVELPNNSPSISKDYQSNLRLEPRTTSTKESNGAWQLPSKASDTLIDNPEPVQLISPIRPPPQETSIDDEPVVKAPQETFSPVRKRSDRPKVKPPLPPKKDSLRNGVATDQRTTESFIEDTPSYASLEQQTVKIPQGPSLKSPPRLETSIDDVPSGEFNGQDSLTASSPRSSETSYSTSLSSWDQPLSIETKPRLKTRSESDLNRGFISDGHASPTSHQSDIDDHNVTSPTSPEVTSSEDWNNSNDSYEINSPSQADDSNTESSVSETNRKPRSLRQIKRKIAQHRAYKSALQSGLSLTPTQLSSQTNREDIIASRRKFLSEGNLSKSEQSERQKQLFDDYKKHLLSPLPKIGAFKPNQRFRTKSSYSSVEKLQHISDLYASRRESDSDSFHRPDIHELHKNCILSPEGRREIHDKTLSIENLNLELQKFDSDASFAETDLDAWRGEPSAYSDAELELSLYLQQQPSDRAVSMSDLRSERAPRKPGSRRFADRHLTPKSKSLQTLETNIDEDDDVFPSDTVSRTPSVHELRVTKSLSKLNVPDWYKQSNLLSKSHSTILRRDSTSTMSSFGYSAFSPSLVSSPCPSVTSQSGNVVIKTRVTPSSSSKIFRKYTPATTAQEEYRRSILDNKSKSTPNVRLPSEKFRQKEKPKGLMPVPILSFTQIRAMFEAKAANAKAADRKQEENSKPKSPEMGKKEKPTIPTVTFSDDESGPEIPANGKSTSPRPTSPVSPSSPTRTSPPAIETATMRMPESAKVKAPSERKLPKPILKISEHLSRATKSKSGNVSPRVVTPEPVAQAQIEPVSHIEVQATIPIPESAVIQRPVTETTDVKQVPETKSRPELKPKPHSFGSTTRTPEPNPPPPTVNKRPFKNGGLLQTTDAPPPGTLFTIYKHSSTHAQDDIVQTKTKKSYSDVIYDVEVTRSKFDETTVEDVLNCLLALDSERKSKRIQRRHTTGKGDRKKSEQQSHYRRFLSAEALEPRKREICSTTWSADYNDGNEVSFRDLESDELDDIIVHCENPGCDNNCVMSIAKRNYLTCHNCYTYYCCKECRKTDWSTHRNDCYISRVHSLCKNLVKTVNKDAHIQYYLSRFARRGYLYRGRGCVLLSFVNFKSGQKLLQDGLRHSSLSPIYMTLAEINRSSIFGDIKDDLTEMCSRYNPDSKYVVYVGIGVGGAPESDTAALPRTTGSFIEKCATLRLSPAHMLPDVDSADDLAVLVLTAVKGDSSLSNDELRKTRELGVLNIQRKLQQRGVILRYHYPDVYYKLLKFVADSKPFSPEMLNPTDVQTGVPFVCIILMELEPEIEWMPEAILFKRTPMDISGYFSN